MPVISRDEPRWKLGTKNVVQITHTGGRDLMLEPSRLLLWDCFRKELESEARIEATAKVKGRNEYLT